MRGELIAKGRRENEAALQLNEATDRQLAEGEAIICQQQEGSQTLVVTDRRLLIVKVGKWLGERSESIPLGAIGRLSTHEQEGQTVLLQISSVDRQNDDLMLSGEDLGPIARALVACLPKYTGTV